MLSIDKDRNRIRSLWYARILGMNSSIQLVEDLQELVVLFDEGLAIRRSDISEGAAFLNKIVFSPPASMRDEIAKFEPGSSEYYDAQMRLIYEPIAGKQYDAQCEGHETLEYNGMTAFPYGMAPRDTAYWLISYSYLIEIMNLPRGSRILEIGFGTGSLTELLVRSGFQVTAIEMRQSNCEFLTSRVEMFGGSVDVRCGSVEEASFDSEYDAIIFYESFHHMLKPKATVSRLRNWLSETGIFVFGAEPVCDDADPLVPFPWGFRMDGGALCAIRDVGWVEFGFQRTFFVEMLRDLGFDTQNYHLPNYHHSNTWIARQNPIAMIRSYKSLTRQSASS